MSICNICCEKHNKTFHGPIECMYCNFIACRNCCQTYMINENRITCMNQDCGKEWTRKFLRDSFTVSFNKGPLTQIRANLLFDREKSLMPATQIYVENKLRIKKINIECKEIDEQIQQLFIRRQELQKEKKQLERKPADLDERRQFMQPCSVTDCRGYLSTQWKCGLCSTWACPDCHEIIGLDKNAPHTCSPTTVESARLITKDTKPCPKCAARIFKIDGCDQMWCVMCHTAFSWRTGKLETKIHNPEYYRWLRETQGAVPREPQDMIGCDEGLEVGPVMLRQFEIILKQQHPNFTYIKHRLENISRNIIHLREVEIIQENYEEVNRDLRIGFLMNEYDEKEFKIRLQKADKNNSRKRDIQDIYEMVVAVSSDILRRFLIQLTNTTTDTSYSMNTRSTHHPPSQPQLNMVILDEIRMLSRYANECLVDVHYVYSLPVYQFMPSLELISIDKLYAVAYNRSEYTEGSSYIEQAADPELTEKVKSAPNKYAKIWACWEHAMKTCKIGRIYN